MPELDSVAKNAIATERTDELVAGLNIVGQDVCSEILTRMQFESNARPSRRKAVVTSECDDLEQRHTLCGEGAGGDTSSQRVTEADRTAIASSDISLRGYDHADLRLYGYSRGSSDEPFEPTAPSEGTARTGELHREMSGPTGDAEEDQLMVGGTVDGWLQAPAGGEMWDDQAFMEVMMRCTEGQSSPKQREEPSKDADDQHQLWDDERFAEQYWRQQQLERTRSEMEGSRVLSSLYQCYHY